MMFDKQQIQDQVFNYSCLTIGLLSLQFVSEMNLEIKGRIQLSDDLADLFFEVLELA